MVRILKNAARQQIATPITSREKAEALIICRYLIGKVPNIFCQRQVSWLVGLLNTFPPMWLSPFIGSGHCSISLMTGLLLKNEDC